jgi:hypothetical protein
VKKCLQLFGFCAILCALLISIPRSEAQATTGAITGQVVDATGAVIPNAVITATDINKGISFRGNRCAL